MIENQEGTYGVGDILLGFEPKDAGSIPAGSVILSVQPKKLCEADIRFLQLSDLDRGKEHSRIGRVVR